MGRKRNVMPPNASSLLEHDVHEVELLGVAVGVRLHGDDGRGGLAGGLVGVGHTVCVLAGEVLDLAMDLVAGVACYLGAVVVVLGLPLEVLSCDGNP